MDPTHQRLPGDGRGEGVGEGRARRFLRTESLPGPRMSVSEPMAVTNSVGGLREREGREEEAEEPAGEVLDKVSASH